MMISPESYYNDIKNKTKEEILVEIIRLKSDINRLKNIVEDPYYTLTMFPAESTQLSHSQMYLSKAKLAYAQAGGVYKPTREEEKEVEFNRLLDNLIKLTFNYEDDKRTKYEYVVDLKDELESYVILDNKQTSSSLWYNYQIINSKKVFLDMLNFLDMGQWRSRYLMRDFGYPEADGPYWKLTLEFNNGHQSITFEGNNVYPYSFYILLRLFGIED